MILEVAFHSNILRYFFLFQDIWGSVLYKLLYKENNKVEVMGLSQETPTIS